MHIRDYWLMFRRRWWIIVVVALAATAGSYLYCKMQTPVYQATVSLLVQPARADLGLTEATNRLLRQYSLQLQTDDLARTVSERLNLDISPQALQGMVTATAVPEDFAVTVQVTDVSAERARDVAFVLADEFEQEQAVRMQSQDPRDRIDVAMVSRPGLGQQIWPSTKTIVLAGAVFGVLLGVVLAFLFELFDDTLKTAEDVERWGRVSVLATIPRASARKARGTGQAGGAGQRMGTEGTG
ncbi:MAG: YveK family protein [Chloroflexota bacterium]